MSHFSFSIPSPLSVILISAYPLNKADSLAFMVTVLPKGVYFLALSAIVFIRKRVRTLSALIIKSVFGTIRFIPFWAKELLFSLIISSWNFSICKATWPLLNCTQEVRFALYFRIDSHMSETYSIFSLLIWICLPLTEWSILSMSGSIFWVYVILACCSTLILSALSCCKESICLCSSNSSSCSSFALISSSFMFLQSERRV